MLQSLGLHLMRFACTWRSARCTILEVTYSMAAERDSPAGMADGSAIAWSCELLWCQRIRHTSCHPHGGGSGQMQHRVVEHAGAHR